MYFSISNIHLAHQNIQLWTPFGLQTSNCVSFAKITCTVSCTLLLRFSHTAGLPITWTLRLHHTFCWRGPVLNPRPVLNSPAKTTRGILLELFCKTCRRVGKVFEGFEVIGTVSAFWAQIDFLLSQNYCTQVTSVKIHSVCLRAFDFSRINVSY